MSLTFFLSPWPYNFLLGILNLRDVFFIETLKIQIRIKYLNLWYCNTVIINVIVILRFMNRAWYNSLNIFYLLSVVFPSATKNNWSYFKYSFKNTNNMILSW